MLPIASELRGADGLAARKERRVVQDVVNAGSDPDGGRLRDPGRLGQGKVQRKRPMAPENSRRCRTPTSPGPGCEKTCPRKGSSPSTATPLLSLGLIAPCPTYEWTIVRHSKPDNPIQLLLVQGGVRSVLEGPTRPVQRAPPREGRKKARRSARSGSMTGSTPRAGGPVS